MPFEERQELPVLDPERIQLVEEKQQDRGFERRPGLS